MNIKFITSALMIAAVLSLSSCTQEKKSELINKTDTPALSLQNEEQSKPKHKFSVVGISNDRNKHLVTVNLSTPLKSDLELEGLVTLQGGGNYRLEKSTTGYEDDQKGIIKIRYEETGASVLSVWISQDLKDNFGRALGKDYRKDIEQSPYKPYINIQVEGTFLPSDSKLLLPFEAVNIAAVDINVVQIFADNVLKFMQDNDLDSDWNIPQNGRLVYSTIYRLDENTEKDLSMPNLFSLDLNKMFKREKGAVYRIYISAKEEYSLYEKDRDEISDELDEIIKREGNNQITAEDNIEWDNPQWYYYPDEAEFYDVCNFVASDLGVIAKSSDRLNWAIAISDINSAVPVEGAKVEFYNYQLQHIVTAYSDADGFVTASLSAQPFAAIVKKDKSVSYIKLLSGRENSLSRFDVGGEKLKKGLKAYIYGERGAWRPGDTLHLSMFLHESGKVLPENLPVNLELYTSQGNFHSSKFENRSKKGLYCFSIPTNADDPTGTWTANFKVAGVTFTKKVIIETIKPNRLKSTLKIDKALSAGDSVNFDVEAHWLIGSPGKNLNVKAEMKLYPITEPFTGYEDYCFINPISDYNGSYIPLFSAMTDSLGCATAKLKMPDAIKAPGMMNAKIMTSVYEPSGSASVRPSVVKFSPHDAYIGIKLPKTSDNEYLETDNEYNFEIAVLDREGKPIKDRELKYSIWKISWRWWWEKEKHSTAYYADDNHSELISRGTIKSDSEKMTLTLKIKYPDWGRYLILVEDVHGNHKTGGIVHVDWPSWRGRSDKGDPNNVSMLTFSTDKTKYRVGENAIVYIPACEGGRALVSIENGSRIISKQWVETSENTDTQYRFPITSEMAPNCYIHITLLQQYSSSANDLPLRMYGVQPLFVDNPESKLEPVISAPDKITPEKPFVVKVKEAKGRPMAYTLAIVDEGLLDVTNFETPNAWSTMYKREALGVKTWDIYDDVVGAYNGQYGPIFSVGGDQNLTSSDKNDDRFKPVVRFMGPFYSDGTTLSHEVTLPMYVGNVRVMVVAGANGAYGNAEKNISVTSPLMLLGSMPMVVGCDETISLPVNIFAMDNEQIDAEICIDIQGSAKIKGTNKHTIRISEEQLDALTTFELHTDKQAGEFVVTITGKGNGHSTKEISRVKVVDKSIDKTPRKPRNVEAGIDFESCFLFAMNYPYRCSEQIASIGITMLSSERYLTPEQQEYIKETIPEFISLLYSRQNKDGGFAYWPSGKSHEWVTSMAGQFLLMAKAAGYPVSSNVISKWEKYQDRRANNFERSENDQTQAYRLYTLALANKPNNGAMNRMKENDNTSSSAKNMLACAYAAIGKQNVAKELINNQTSTTAYDDSDITFGSEIRDLSIYTLAHSLSGNESYAAQGAVQLAHLFNNSYFVTQNTAFATSAFSHIAREQIAKHATDSTNFNGKIQIKGEIENCLELDITYKDQYDNTIEVDTIKQGTEFLAIIKLKNNSPVTKINNIALTYQLASGFEIFNERLYGNKEYDCDYYDIRDDKIQWFLNLKQGESKEYKVRLRASYSGEFAHPSAYAEAMYAPEQYVTTEDSHVTIE